jgi:hypothetical protein
MKMMDFRILWRRYGNFLGIHQKDKPVKLCSGRTTMMALRERKIDLERKIYKSNLT